MNESEFLTAVLSSGRIEGRTTVQKLAYFASLKVGLKLGYVPHYYGPYSSRIAGALGNLSSLGFVKEDARWTQREHRIFGYSLTDDGKVVLDKVEHTYPREFKRIEKVVSDCIRIAGNNAERLALAAKVHYIVKKAGKPISYSSVRTIAGTLGWNLSKEDIGSSAKLLQALSLVKSTNQK